MKPNVYLETTVVSYLTARPSRDFLTMSSITQTKRWWDQCRGDSVLWVSDVVLRECARGDVDAAKRRLASLDKVAVLRSDEQSDALAEFFLRNLAMPANATDDAFHVAIAAVNRMDYLLTWNCRHIASAYVRPKLQGLCMAQGFRCPIICTPPELMTPDYDKDHP